MPCPQKSISAGTAVRLRILSICASRTTRTDEAITKNRLQVWVDYANKAGAVIIYDAAYKLISQKRYPGAIYPVCEGAKPCAIELAAFPRQPDFTGSVSCIHEVIPKSSNAAMCAACTLGKKTRHKIQRCTLHHPETREAVIFRGWKGSDRRTDRILSTRMHLISLTDSKKPAIPLRAA